MRARRIAYLIAGPLILSTFGATLAFAAGAADLPAPAAATLFSADLPDAPDAISQAHVDFAVPAPQPTFQFAFESSSLSSGGASFAGAGAAATSTAVAGGAAPSQFLTTHELDLACQSGQLRGKPCRARWGPILWEAFELTTADNVANIALVSDTRHDLRYNPYWATYIKCVHQYRYRQWTDDTPFIVHNIGHPMQGAIVDSTWEQHAPTARGLVFHNNGNYWRSRLKAMAWTAAFEVDWKIGPASEASIGNSGLNTYTTPALHGKTTNETGFQDFVITPVYGTAWNIGEDAIDRYLMPKIWKRTHNRPLLTLMGVLTPCKSAANLARFKPIYYRDYPITPLR